MSDEVSDGVRALILRAKREMGGASGWKSRAAKRFDLDIKQVDRVVAGGGVSLPTAAAVWVRARAHDPGLALPAWVLGFASREMGGSDRRRRARPVDVARDAAVAPDHVARIAVALERIAAALERAE